MAHAWAVLTATTAAAPAAASLAASLAGGGRGRDGAPVGQPLALLHAVERRVRALDMAGALLAALAKAGQLPMHRDGARQIVVRLPACAQ